MAFFKLFGKGNSVETKQFPSEGITVDTIFRGVSDFRRITDPKTLMEQNKGWVRICVQRNASTVAAVPFHLYAATPKGAKTLFPTKTISNARIKAIQHDSKNALIKSGEQVVEILDHPVLDLLYSVNRDLGQNGLFTLTEQYLELLGFAFWQIIKDSQGVPNSINVMPAEAIYKIANNQVLFRVDNKELTYNLDDVIWFKNICAGSILGKGDLEGCMEAVQMMNSFDLYEKSLAENNGMPNVLVKYKSGRLTDDVQKQLVRKWNQMLRGYGNAGKTKVVDMDIDVINLNNPKDINFEKGRDVCRQIIISSFGVPLDLVDSTSSNRATSLTAINQYMQFTINPKVKRLEDTLNDKLLPMFDDRLTLEFESAVKEDEEMELKETDSDIKNGIRSINEIRIERGLEPYPEDVYNRPILPSQEINPKVG